MSTQPDEVAAALLTPGGRGAVAVIGLRGADAATIVGRHFVPAAGKLEPWVVGRIRFGRWRSRLDDSAEAGEELVVARTADDEFEVHGHGGAAAPATILASLADSGCRVIPWQTWSAARIDPIEAEARTALASATTTRTAGILLDQLAGALRRALDDIARLHAAGKLHEARGRIARLIELAETGRRVTQPFQVVLAGRPNVGKSSLMNTLLGYDRAVVFDEPGTTRDVVTAATAFDGWPVELRDTAGLRDSTSDAIERAGMAAARGTAATADLVVLVCDRTEAWSTEDAALWAKHPAALLVHNKCDRPPSDGPPPPPGLEISARDGLGIDRLIAMIVARLVPNPPAPGEAVPFTERQTEWLRWLLDSMSAPNP